MNIQKTLWISKNILKCNLHTTAALTKVQAGRYKITRDRSKPLNYEQSFWPEQIAIKKGTPTYLNHQCLHTSNILFSNCALKPSICTYIHNFLEFLHIFQLKSYLLYVHTIDVDVKS